MRSTPTGPERSADDLTARARIRDAAVRRFATDGLAAPLRTIAADAGVSPGLILHHFGSRDGLRDECDQFVLDEMFRADDELLRDSGASTAAAWLAGLGQHSAMVGYMLRLLQHGGPVLTAFVDRMVAATVDYLEAGVADGSIRPSLAPRARARYIVESSLGALLLRMPAARDRLDLDALADVLQAYTEEVTVPTLELYTEGLLVDRSLLEAFAANLPGESPGTEPEQEGHHT
ncbi:TetR/AcrR family transcriptional regulator [Occultella glacieicola]|uniref:TetR/AcrR family transcriptional regulator n=1 Tax=Occultella glacieicola TaxID=2518684 RepID=UPI001F35431F|nr:TetR/AcrR family transcriptional regulator [Occultella glacieicola]